MAKMTREIITCTAGEALLAKARVKIKGANAAGGPVEVEYADGGEQAIGVVEYGVASGALAAIRLITWGGTLEGLCNDTFAIGATLYAADDGEISDSSDGSAIGVALEACTAAGDIVEYMPFGVLSTTAATVSYADATGSGFTAETTVEGALDEIYQHIQSAQNFIPIPLNLWRETTNFDVANIAANGGLLASDTTPVLDAINAATDGCQRILWAASGVDQIACSIPLPPNLDTTADLVLHTRIVSGGTTNAVGFTVDSFFNEADGKVTDTSATNQTQTWAEKTTTIAATDIPSGAQTITIGLTPVAHGDDTLAMSASWLEYTGTTLAS